MDEESISIKTFKYKHKNVLVLPEACRNKVTENIRNAEVYYSMLPTCHISLDNEDFEAIKHDRNHKEYAEMKLYDINGSCEYNGEIKIHTRGNTSFAGANEKKSYTIKLTHRQALLNMRPTKSYCLLNNIADESMIRNAVAFDIAKQIGVPAPDYEYIQVFINGDYQGLYLMTNKAYETSITSLTNLEKANKVVNKKPLRDYPLYESENEIAYLFDENPIDYTGGYCVEISTESQRLKSPCSFVSAGGEFLRVRYPKYISKAEIDYIRECYNTLETFVLSQDTEDPLLFVDYIDLESFAKFYMLEELYMDHDCGIASTFICKDAGNNVKFSAGPIWDMDFSMSSYFWHHYIREINSIYAASEKYISTTYGGLFYQLNKHQVFREKVKSLFLEYQEKLCPQSKTYFKIEESAYNNMRWTKNCLYEGIGVEVAQQEVYDFLLRRYNFLSWFYETPDSAKVNVSISTRARNIQLYSAKDSGCKLPEPYINTCGLSRVKENKYFLYYEDINTKQKYQIGDYLHNNSQLIMCYREPSKFENWMMKDKKKWVVRKLKRFAMVKHCNAI